MAWHGGSEYGHSSHFLALDRNGRARWRYLTRAQHVAGRLTRAARDVAEALMQHHGPAGRCDPSQATLAEAAACCERTVRRALDQLAACGLVAWTRRITRTRHGARQTSSAYRLTEAPIDATRPAGQKGRGTRILEITKAQAVAAVPMDFPRPTESLAQISQRRAEALAAAWRKARLA